MKKLLITTIALTAIGVAVKATKKNNAVLNHEIDQLKLNLQYLLKDYSSTRK